ncbi:hypothetical protein HT574_11280 [Parageobacillus sp. VR-IP]|uniref:hypothetical protein n=1 Tax=Parageobacillus sp. VR-IP TaxID=2742205 RepID=UPI0015818F3E|nr:hypothetical protein [Parageobacillus sp. VR-IP]NUK30634.1 hypothetical protein [Parageobacillus sp. VR-IP]
MNEISDIIGISKDEEMKLLRIQVLAIYPFDWLAVIILMQQYYNNSVYFITRWRSGIYPFGKMGDNHSHRHRKVITNAHLTYRNLSNSV